MTRSQSFAPEHSYNGEKLSLLAILAHPDDEGFGPAGTLAKYASEGVQVSLVTAARPTQLEDPIPNAIPLLNIHIPARDRACSCRTSGIRRVCFLDLPTNDLSQVDSQMIEEQIVRLIREIKPQVVITSSPDGWGDQDHSIISRASAAAFRDAGNSAKFTHHFQDGLGAYAPLKLYYCVLPASEIARWGISGMAGVPDDQVTATLDVSSYSESMTQTLFCHRNKSLDYIRWLIAERQLEWKNEYYALAGANVKKKMRREKDLFAGLR